MSSALLRRVIAGGDATAVRQMPYPLLCIALQSLARIRDSRGADIVLK